MNYILLDVLVCSTAEYFYELCRILTSPEGESNYKQHVICYLTALFFFAKCFCLFFLRREKRSGKRSVARVADWLNRFLQYKITNCPNNRTISQDICTLFARYLYSTLCSWIIISTYSEF